MITADLDLINSSKIAALTKFIEAADHHFYSGTDGRRGLAAYHAARAIMNVRRKQRGASSKLGDVRAALKAWNVIVTYKTDTGRVRLFVPTAQAEMFVV